MNKTIARLIVPLALLATFAPGANAQTETRAQVRSELAEAIRAGDGPGRGEIGLKADDALRRLRDAAPAITRAQVKAELAQAIRSGDILTAGDGSTKANELYPLAYPATVVASTRTREEVKAELAEAIRSGDVVAAGESGLKLNEEFPQRYAKVRAHDAGMRLSAAQAASAAAR